MSFNTFWFYSADRMFLTKDFTVADLTEMLIDEDPEVDRRYMPGPTSFCVQTFLLALVIGKEYHALEKTLYDNNLVSLSAELAQIHRKNPVLAVPNPESASIVFESLIEMARKAGGIDFPNTYNGEGRVPSNLFHMTNQMAFITVVNQTSHALKMTGSSAYKGDIACTFPQSDPMVRCFGEPLYSVGIFGSRSTSTTGAASAIELSPATTSSGSSSFRVVIASACPIAGERTLLVAVNSSDPATLANQNDTKGDKHFEKKIENTNIQVEASVENQAAYNVCHVRVVISETN